MWPTTTLDDNVIDLNAILHPGTVFEHPRDVVSHPALSFSEERAILASWARTPPPFHLALHCNSSDASDSSMAFTSSVLFCKKAD